MERRCWTVTFVLPRPAMALSAQAQAHVVASSSLEAVIKARALIKPYGLNAGGAFEVAPWGRWASRMVSMEVIDDWLA